METFVVTGGAGFLGSHIVYELLETHAHALEELRIVNLYHRGGTDPLELFRNQGLYYPRTAALPLDHILSRMIHIPVEMTEAGLGLSKSDADRLASMEVDHVIHTVAVTDFRSNPTIVRKLRATNVEGTARLIDFFAGTSAGRATFHYIGSAYACGSWQGVVQPHQSSRVYRNFYEETKHTAEAIVQDKCANAKTRFAIYRFPNIGGRMLNEPIGYTTKYDVFYAWVRFFHSARARQGIPANERWRVDLRLRVRKGQGINICPVDYGAKLLVRLLRGKHGKTHSHVVANNNYDHAEFAAACLSALGIEGYQLVEEAPRQEDMNALERKYYTFVGSIFDGYLNDGPMLFDTSDLQERFAETLALCPPIDDETFGRLLGYALRKEFRT